MRVYMHIKHVMDVYFSCLLHVCFSILDEPPELLRIVRTAVISCPSVADGEFVEFQHIHNAHFSYNAAKQVWTLNHACRCV